MFLPIFASPFLFLYLHQPTRKPMEYSTRKPSTPTYAQPYKCPVRLENLSQLFCLFHSSQMPTHTCYYEIFFCATTQIMATTEQMIPTETREIGGKQPSKTMSEKAHQMTGPVWLYIGKRQKWSAINTMTAAFVLSSAEISSIGMIMMDWLRSGKKKVRFGRGHARMITSERGEIHDTYMC